MFVGDIAETDTDGVEEARTCVICGICIGARPAQAKTCSPEHSKEWTRRYNRAQNRKYHQVYAEKISRRKKQEYLVRKQRVTIPERTHHCGKADCDFCNRNFPALLPPQPYLPPSFPVVDSTRPLPTFLQRIPEYSSSEFIVRHDKPKIVCETVPPPSPVTPKPSGKPLKRSYISQHQVKRTHYPLYDATEPTQFTFYRSPQGALNRYVANPSSPNHVYHAKGIIETCVGLGRLAYIAYQGDPQGPKRFRKPYAVRYQVHSKDYKRLHLEDELPSIEITLVPVPPVKGYV